MALLIIRRKGISYASGKPVESEVFEVRRTGNKNALSVSSTLEGAQSHIKLIEDQAREARERRRVINRGI